MAQEIKGRSAIVTGAGSGINFCFARALLDRGANVLFADLTLRPEAQELVDRHSNGSPRAAYLKTDVRSWSDLSRMFDIAHEKFGSIDIVCPGAGVFEPPFSHFWHPPGQPPSLDDPQGDRYASIDINITHPIRVTQLAISYFLSTNPRVSTSNPKTIIHIASVAGEVSAIPTPLYHASKHAILGFVRSFAVLESTLGIRVAAVAPGFVKTPLWSKEKLASWIRTGDEWISPENVADVMCGLVEKDELSNRYGENIAEAEKIHVRGGSIIEIAKGRLRDVPMLGNVGPGGVPGTTAGGLGELTDEVQTLLSTEGWGKN